VFLAIRYCSSSVLCAEIGSLVNSAHPGRIGKRKWGDTAEQPSLGASRSIRTLFIGHSEQNCSAFCAPASRYYK
jgi:hypothetical protein